MPDTLFDKAVINLKEIWGFSSFRDKQEEAVRSILNGDDTLVLFPTGGGKSLCYQLPASVLDGLTIVISPLIALMQDQISQLQQLNINATFINSTLPDYEIEQRLINARNGMYSILYCSPERLTTPTWQYELPNLNIKLVAVDEAHCISEWGHDFRPSYRTIYDSFEQVKDDITWLALTATATPEVQEDICQSLHFDEPNIISGGFERPNLKWWVTESEQKLSKLLQLLRRAGDASGLIYANTRRKCDQLAEILNEKGYGALSYHAGMESEERKKVQQSWLDGHVQWIVATNAFGMGIDKPDCRYVFHYDMPNSLENYYQEAGRAGRDGKLAYPILLYRETDYRRVKKHIEQAYPGRDVLQKVYDALCDSMDLAIGAVYEQTFQVDVDELVRRNKLSHRIQLSGLRMLDQFDVLTMVSDYKSSIGTQFVLSHNALIDLIDTTKNKAKADFIDQLFRLYGPESQHEMIFLEDGYLCDKLDKSFNQIVKGMEILQNEQVINYEIRNGNPLVNLHESRYSKLPYTARIIEQYRNILLKKLEFMHDYVRTNTCRSKFIRTYFGEKRVPGYCGICDVCTERTKKITDVVRTENVRAIYNALKDKPLTNRQLVEKTGIRKYDLDQTLKMLLKEGIVSTNVSEVPVFYLSDL